MITKLWGWLGGRKTYIVVVVMVIYAMVVVGWGSGNWEQAMTLVFAALGLGSVRNAIGTAGKTIK